jgi:hypothetical protein
MRRLLLFWALSLVIGDVAITQDRPCPASMPALNSWDELYKSFGLFKSCDDGAYAEGYSESVARILVDRWPTLPRLSSLGTRDSAFLKFVLKHVDGTLNGDEIATIRSNARKRCPRGLRSLCADLEKQASAALKDTGD